MILNVDLLHPDPLEEVVEVVVDEDDRTAGVMHMKLRELPEVEFRRLLALRALAVQAYVTLPKASGDLAADAVLLSKISEAEEAHLTALRELVARSVVGHDAEEWRAPILADARHQEALRALGVDGASPDAAGTVAIPFQAGTWRYKGEAKPGASAGMVRVYEHARPKGAFLSALANAVIRFQQRETLSPDQLWTAKEKAAAEAKAKADAERKAKEESEKKATGEAPPDPLP